MWKYLGILILAVLFAFTSCATTGEKGEDGDGVSIEKEKAAMELLTVDMFSSLSSFSFEGYRERILKTVRKSVVIILSLCSTVLTGLLTTQSILASSSDSVVLKGIRFISGTFVPIVGNGVGDAISSVFSSFLIMRNTLGVFVIIVILLINLPAMVELLVWYFALEICSIVSTMFDLNHMSDVIDSLASVISLINTVLFFVTFVLTISTGVIIIMGK